MGAPMVHCMAQNGHAPLIYDALSDAAHKVGKDSTLQVASRLAEVGEHAENRHSDAGAAAAKTWRAAEILFEKDADHTEIFTFLETNKK